jgi:hypothetical protein
MGCQGCRLPVILLCTFGQRCDYEPTHFDAKTRQVVSSGCSRVERLHRSACDLFRSPPGCPLTCAACNTTTDKRVRVCETIHCTTMYLTKYEWFDSKEESEV